MRITELVPLLEGIHDPATFKAVFVVGGPGSGKSYIVDRVGLRALGFVSVNSDEALTHLMHKAHLSLKMPPEEEGRREAVRRRAKEVTAHKFRHALDGRLGLIIDGTGEDYTKVESLVENLKELGYKCYMIFVNTNLETALERNERRERSVPTHIVERKWQGAQDNRERFEEIVDEFSVIDNNGDGDETGPQIDKTHRSLRRWLLQKPEGPEVDRWIEDQRELRRRERDEDEGGSKGERS